MQAWVIVDGNGYPVAIRETEQDAIILAEQIAKDAIVGNSDYTQQDAETVILIPEFDGDNLRVRVYLKERRSFPYMEIYASKFDSTAEPRPA